MSKIKLPHASGNSMSIGAPATNPASDLELKLPATIGTAGQLLKNSSTPGTLEFGGVPSMLANSSSYEGLELQTPSGDGSGEFHIGVHQAGSSSGRSLVFKRGGADGMDTESMRLNASGKLLVGRTSSITIASDPSDHNFEQLTDNGMALALHCNQTNQRGLGIFYTASKAPTDFFRCHVDSAAKVIITGTGNMQNANNSYGSISDISLKENIVDANSQWDDIKNIKIRNYNFKESTGQSTHTQIGVIAQELETVSPKLVEISDKDGMKNVQYSVLYIKAVKALQEAMVKIETLETKVAALEAG